jgi:hypothetical protein
MAPHRSGAASAGLGHDLPCLPAITTLGYGDLVLDGGWRMLASLQEANDAIIIGWTTALIFYFIQKVYSRDQ